MSILDRIKERKARKKQNPVVETENVPLSTVMENPQDLSITNMEGAEKDLMQEPVTTTVPTAQGTESASAASVQTTTPSWVTAGSYEEAAKADPNISRAQYAYELSKHRREQGLPDLSYSEWSNIVKGHDPYETAAERQKREKNMRLAQNISAIGSFINALVNYNRVKRGSVGYTPDKGADTYNRLERIRLNQQQLARSNAKDYLGYISMDRAERAKAEAAAAAKAQAQQNYNLKMQELEWKRENAKTEAERKKAADELAKMKFEETQRHNKEMEKTARIRANRAGTGGSGTKKYLELQTGNGIKRYTPDEHGNNWIHKAYQDMLKEEEGKNYEVRTLWGNSPTEQQMYEAITKYNDSREKNQYRTGRYGGGSKAKPVWE